MSAECWQEQSHHPYFGIRNFKTLYLLHYEQAAARCLHTITYTELRNHFKWCQLQQHVRVLIKCFAHRLVYFQCADMEQGIVLVNIHGLRTLISFIMI